MGNTGQINSFILFLGYSIAILLNCFFVWLALLISGLKTDFKGMLMLSAAAILPANLLPPLIGWLVGLACMAVVASSVTNAKGWVDCAKYVGSSFLISMLLAFLVAYMFWDEIMKAQGVPAANNPSVQVEPAPQVNGRQVVPSASGESQPAGNAPLGAFDALKDQLTPEERAQIERQIAVP